MSNKIENLKSKNIFYRKKIEDYKFFKLTEDKSKTEINNFEINRDYVYNLINCIFLKIKNNIIFNDKV